MARGRRPRPLAHNSFKEPFNQGYSKEYRHGIDLPSGGRTGYDSVNWGPDFSGTNGRYPRDTTQYVTECAVCGRKLVFLETHQGWYCSNPECINYREEEDEEWNDNAETG